MAIYRGPGGPGDATADVSNQSTIALNAANSATTSATVATTQAAIATDAATSATSALASQTGNSGKFLTTDGTATSWDSALKPTNNLSDLDNTTTARTNIGLGNVPNLSFSGSNTGDNSPNTLYSGLVSNATHTGDATGSTALTVVKINGTLLSDLATGILKNTTATGVPSIAVAGTDYLAPASIGTTVQAYDAQLADVAGLTPTDNGVIIGNGTNFVVESGATLKTSLGLTIGTDIQAYNANLTSYATTAPTAAGLALLDDANNTAQRTTLGLGTAATTASTDYATASQGAKADTALQPATIGVTVQAYDAQLADVAGLTPTDNGVVIGNGTNFVVESNATLKTSLGLTIGTDVQAYDATIVKTGVANTFTATNTFKGVVDTVFTITDAAAFEINPANGSIQTITLGANRTPAATNFVAGQCVLLGIDDGTAFTITWTTVAVTWVKAGGTASAPTLATTGYTWVLLWKVGSVVYGATVGSP